MLDQRLLPPGVADVNGKAVNGLLERYSLLDKAVVLTQLIDRVKAQALPHLLEERHVDFVRPDTPQDVQRALIRNSFVWHKAKGTPGALSEVVQTVCAANPQILEKCYFLLGHSQLGDSLAAAEPSMFILGYSQLGQSSLPRPRLGAFDFDLCLSSAQAETLDILREDLSGICQVMRPARTRAWVRFRGFRLGSSYSLLGIDYLN